MADWPIPRQRQGGGERGKLGPRDSTPYQTANRLPVSNQRLPEMPDVWHLLGGSRLETSSPEQTQGTLDRCAWTLRLGPWRGWGAPHPGRVRPSSSWLPELLGRGRHKTKAQPSLCFCGVPENWNRMPLRAHSLLNSLEPEQCRRGKHTRCEWGQTQCGWNTASASHTHQWHLSAVPLPLHSMTEQANLNKRPPLPACVRAETRHWRDLQTEAK